MFPALAPILCSLALAADPYSALNGNWRVVAVFEDGQSIPDRQISTDLISDGRISIDGPTLTVRVPGSFDPKKMAFTLNDKADPKQINLVGTDKIGSQGIYLQSGDTLMICLPSSRGANRPTDFGAAKGTGNILMTFRREANDAPATPMVPPPAPPAPPKEVTETVNITVARVPPPDLPSPPSDADRMQKMLNGTWGHQNDDQVVMSTLNPDGTFSYVLTWKKGVKRVFNSDIRSSGRWRLENGVVVLTVTTSTDRNMTGQVFSFRVVRLGENDLIAIDQQGRTRHEWRVR